MTNTQSHLCCTRREHSDRRCHAEREKQIFLQKDSKEREREDLSWKRKKKMVQHLKARILSHQYLTLYLHLFCKKRTHRLSVHSVRRNGSLWELSFWKEITTSWEDAISSSTTTSFCLQLPLIMDSSLKKSLFRESCQGISLLVFKYDLLSSSTIE